MSSPCQMEENTSIFQRIHKMSIIQTLVKNMPRNVKAVIASGIVIKRSKIETKKEWRERPMSSN
ncbi:unnamed protein product, partial [Larinioides sclopetarius]